MSKKIFSAKIVLPLGVCIESAGTHFYRIGLTQFRDIDVKRSQFRQPILCFVLQLLYLIRSVLVLASHESDINYYRKTGDFGFMFGTVVHYNLAVIFSILLSFLSQVINFYNYKHGIKLI